MDPDKELRQSCPSHLIFPVSQPVNGALSNIFSSEANCILYAVCLWFCSPKPDSTSSVQDALYLFLQDFPPIGRLSVSV